MSKSRGEIELSLESHADSQVTSKIPASQLISGPLSVPFDNTFPPIVNSLQISNINLIVIPGVFFDCLVGWLVLCVCLFVCLTFEATPNGAQGLPLALSALRNYWLYAEMYGMQQVKPGSAHARQTPYLSYLLDSYFITFKWGY